MIHKIYNVSDYSIFHLNATLTWLKYIEMVMAIWFIPMSSYIPYQTSNNKQWISIMKLVYCNYDSVKSRIRYHNIYMYAIQVSMPTLKHYFFVLTLIYDFSLKVWYINNVNTRQIHVNDKLIDSVSKKSLSFL